MSVVTIRTAGAGEVDSVFARLKTAAATVLGWGAGLRREREEAALLGRMSQRELRDIGLTRAGGGRFVTDCDRA